MLKALDLRCTHDGTPLFEGLALTLGPHDRCGLIGPNGAGKTTLLRVLAGTAAPAHGTVALAPGTRVGYLPQEPPGGELTLDRLLGAALGEAWRLRGELERLERRLDDPDALHAYGEAQEQFAALDGWRLAADLDTARRALEIEHLPLHAPLGELSGGEAARALLAGVLLARPTVLLLDEPTNHLDADGLAWLEAFLAGFDGALLVVSHDRRFLDVAVTRVLELDAGELTAYTGGYSAYRAEKARRRARQELLHEAQEKRRRRLEADITATRGFAMRTETTAPRASAPGLKRKAKKVAKKAGARERRLERELASDDRVEAPAAAPRLTMSLAGSSGAARVAALRGVTAGHGGEVVIRGLDLDVHGRDRILVTGANGAGKSTLLALLAGQLEPAAGRAELPVAAALLPQVAQALPLDATPAAFVRERSGAGEADARRLLGHFGLEGADALRPMRTTSPGERARIAVAAMVATRAPLLLLDEPTNHLDLPALEVLEAALRDYPGALVVASHDRAFVEVIGVTRRLRVADGEVSEM
jgi:ATPase subunit of ABC transporter with duplicated ATPase domains